MIKSHSENVIKKIKSCVDLMPYFDISDCEFLSPSTVNGEAPVNSS